VWYRKIYMKITFWFLTLRDESRFVGIRMSSDVDILIAEYFVDVEDYLGGWVQDKARRRS